MRRRELQDLKRRTAAIITTDFAQNISLRYGLIFQGDNLDQGYVGAKGLLIPWNGDPNIKVLIGGAD